MYNKVVLVGNLTRDIELRYSQAGMAIAKTAIATSRKFTANGEKKEETMFIDITFFGRSGEVANQYLKKGSKILVEGRIQFEQWVDQNGGKRSKHSIAVETMQMLDNKESGGQNQSAMNNDMPQPQEQSYGTYGNNQQSQQRGPQQGGHQQRSPQQGGRQQSMPEDLPSIDIDEDEIPF